MNFSILKKIKKYLVLSIHNLIFLLSFIIPRDKSLWVFGAWFGQKYCDNSKYLFEYIKKNAPQIKAVWISKNREVINFLNTKGIKSYHANSIFGIYYTTRAKVCVISSSISDVTEYACGRIKIINLWHGTPLKKIMHDDEITFKKNMKSSFFFRTLFPYFNQSYRNAMLIAASENVAKTMTTAFKTSPANVKITGYPRNDAFFNSSVNSTSFFQKLYEYKKNNLTIGIYMPTHRKGGNFDIFTLFEENIKELNENLKNLKSILIIKFHYCHMQNLKNKNLSYSNIIFLKDKDINQDIYSILGITDFLITDYSSIYFDYLLLDKPIFFAPFDKSDYLKNDRAFYYNYDEITPGQKCNDWKDILNCIKNLDYYSNHYRNQRNEIRNKFNKFLDGNNCKRVFHEILNFIKYY